MSVPPLNIDALRDESERVGLEWADANAAASALEETRKSVLADLMVGYIGEGNAVNKAETFALASKLYRMHVDAMVEARREADRAKVRYETLKTHVELLRTQAANERAAMQMNR